MRLAAFDFGSNSIKCLIADVENGQITEIRDIRAQNRLASYLQGGVLADNAIPETLAMLQPLLDTCRTLKVQKILAVATEALRSAVNGSACVAAIAQQSGVAIRIIPPHEEAELAWRGVISGLDLTPEELCLFDSGGASTEFILGYKDKIKQINSLALGAVALARDYITADPLSECDSNSLKAAIDGALRLPFGTCGKLIGTGGGVLACAKVALGCESIDPKRLDGYVLTAGELERQLKLYEGSSIAQRKSIPGMEAARADIIPASTMLFYKILKHFRQDSLAVSTRGIRQGLLLSSSQVPTRTPPG